MSASILSRAQVEEIANGRVEFVEGDSQGKIATRFLQVSALCTTALACIRAVEEAPHYYLCPQSGLCGCPECKQKPCDCWKSQIGGENA